MAGRNKPTGYSSGRGISCDSVTAARVERFRAQTNCPVAGRRVRPRPLPSPVSPPGDESMRQMPTAIIRTMRPNTLSRAHYPRITGERDKTRIRACWRNNTVI